MALNDDWLTLAEIGARIGRPDNTVRRWARDYRIPSRPGRGRARVYPLHPFERIAVMADQRLTSREIARELAGEGETTEATEARRAAVLILLEEIRDGILRVSELLEQIRDRTI